MKVFFFFLDGVGLGPDDPAINPLARADMPNLRRLLDGGRLVAGHPSPGPGTLLWDTPLASVVALDACLGVGGMPQSATGQAALLTGLNVPGFLGEHFGPWPNRTIVHLLQNGNLFRAVRMSGRRAALLNAYPPSYFAAIASGRRLYSAVPQAVVSAGVALKTDEDLREGRALAADFTGIGWHTRLHLFDTPVLTPEEAGERLARLAQAHDFSFFEYWLSDYAGHAQDMDDACSLLETFDTVLGALLAAWRPAEGIILITSDHGNMEDLSTHGHTTNPVPAIVIGEPQARREFAASLRNLTHVAPAIMRMIKR